MWLLAFNFRKLLANGPSEPRKRGAAIVLTLHDNLLALLVVGSQVDAAVRPVPELLQSPSAFRPKQISRQLLKVRRSERRKVVVGHGGSLTSHFPANACCEPVTLSE